jgi:copper(I)-binding protein
VNRILVLVLGILVLLSSCATPTIEGIEVRDAWARPAAQGGNGAVYFVIRSSEMDEIIGVSSDVADAVEMHESQMSGDVMEMHPLHAVPLDAGKQVPFEPGGLHVMLIGLKQDLVIGNEFEITLHFKKFPDLTVNVPVRDTPAARKDH